MARDKGSPISRMAGEHVAAVAPSELSEVERPRRLSLSRVVELLLEKGSGEHHEVTLTRNAKGDTQIVVTVRARAGGEIETPEQASAIASRLYDELAGRYPIAPPASPSSSPSKGAGEGAAR